MSSLDGELIGIPATTVFVTGAGVSASAGLKTYREEGSSWSDSNLEKMSHATRFGNHLNVLNPHWLDLSREFSQASPTLFHRFIADGKFKVITQNVDGLHSMAGSKEVLELHGSMRQWRGLKGKETFDSSELVDSFERGFREILHPSLGRRVRPDIVLFGEKPKQVEKALSWIKKAELTVFAGTSGNVLPAAGWATLNPNTILVDPNPWGRGIFKKVHAMTTDKWVMTGAPGL